ncbi:MAG: cation:proton antiporter [Verrucomicrobiales bacterium]
MTGLVILIVVAALGFTLARWLNLPVIPPLVILGFLLANSGLPVNTEEFSIWLELGLAFLVYSAGIELDPQRFKRNREAVVWIALLQFAVLSLAGFGLALLLGFENSSAVYIGCALATSSTLVVVRQLQKRMVAFGPYGRLVIGVLLVQDLMIIFVIVLLFAVHGGAVSLLSGFGGLIFMSALAYAARAWGFPRLISRCKLADEVVLLVFLATLFIFAGLAESVGLPFVVGAFFAGLSLSAFPVNGVARSLLSTLSSFFVAVFFTALGARVPVPDPALLGMVLIFVAVVILITTPLVSALAEWKGRLSSGNAITSGLLLAQTSEFAIVIAVFALDAGAIAQEVMTLIVLVSVITMILTPFVATDSMAQRLLRFHPLRRRLATETELRDHILMLGLGAAGIWAVKPLVAAGHQVVVVDHDPAVIEHLQSAGVSVICGDGSDAKILERAGFRHARLVLIGIPDMHEVLRLLRWARSIDVPKFVRVFEESHAAQVEAEGGHAILNSHAAADTFMEWFDEVVERDGASRQAVGV